MNSADCVPGDMIGAVDEIVAMQHRRFPEMPRARLAILLVAAAGMLMADESFPDMPVFDVKLATVMGVAAGLQLKRRIEAEKQSCGGMA